MEFCDLKCIHASAPKEEMDGSRSCMTFTAIWCGLFERHVMKSQPCGEKKERNFKSGRRTPLDNARDRQNAERSGNPK